MVYPKRPLLFVAVVTFSSIVPILMNFIGPKRLLGMLSSYSGKRTDDDRVAKIIIYTDFMMGLKPWHYMKNICLVRSTILYYFLRREGVAVKINFGVRKKGEVLEGHGWLTLDNRPYLEDGAASQDFEQIYSFPS